METKSIKPTQKAERMTVLGSRVFRRHRKMIRELAKKKKLKDGEIVRIAIEKLYESESSI